MKHFIRFLVFICFLIIFSFNILAQERRDKRLNGLTLLTKVTKITAKQDSLNFINFNVEIENTFINTGDTPIIILQPENATTEDDEPLWYAGISITTKDSERTGDYPIYYSGGLPSVCGCKMELDDKLDKKTPPKNLTQILKKGESWMWKTTAGFNLAVKGKNYYGNYEAISLLKT